MEFWVENGWFTVVTETDCPLVGPHSLAYRIFVGVLVLSCMLFSVGI